jgi:site-specific DNA recombinase
VVEVFADRAVSAASRHRPGYQAMLDRVRGGAVDLVLAESLDRLSRDQEDVAALFKRLVFWACAWSPSPRARSATCTSASRER